MTTQYTPYETRPPLPDPEPKRSSATKPLMIVLAVIGGIALVVAIATTIFSSAMGLSRGSATLTADATGVTALDVDANAAQFILEFAEVNEATLRSLRCDVRIVGNSPRSDTTLRGRCPQSLVALGLVR